MVFHRLTSSVQLYGASPDDVQFDTTAAGGGGGSSVSRLLLLARLINRQDVVFRGFVRRNP